MPLVMITGGAVRLGKGLALGFAGKKWDVVFTYHHSNDKVSDTIDKIRSFGVNCSSYKLDITDAETVSSVFNEIINTLGIPDVLINNSGIFPGLAEIKEINEEMWDKTLDTNAKGAFLCSKKFAEFALEGAHIINIGSLGGLEIWKHRIPYNVSKAALIQLSKALARELAPKISVNCINPGTIHFPDEPATTDYKPAGTDRIPMKRFGNIHDIFDAVWFFATCSNYITGQSINVDGGFHDAR